MKCNKCKRETANDSGYCFDCVKPLARIVTPVVFPLDIQSPRHDGREDCTVCRYLVTTTLIYRRGM